AIYGPSGRPSAAGLGGPKPPKAGKGDRRTSHAEQFLIDRPRYPRHALIDPPIRAGTFKFGAINRPARNTSRPFAPRQSVGPLFALVSSRFATESCDFMLTQSLATDDFDLAEEQRLASLELAAPRLDGYEVLELIGEGTY